VAGLAAERRTVLAGDVRLRAMLRRAVDHGCLTDTDIDGNHDATLPRELAASGWEIVLQASHGQAAPDSPDAEGVTKRYGGATNVRAFDRVPGTLTEMDAVVAYLQILGRLTDAAHRPVAAIGR
jgi:hypothetical protein